MLWDNMGREAAEFLMQKKNNKNKTKHTSGVENVNGGSRFSPLTVPHLSSTMQKYPHLPRKCHN